MTSISVLFVCTENICRSPLAEAMMRQLLEEQNLHKRIRVKSAGTLVSQPGHKPDPRAVKVAGKYGLRMTSRRAQRIRATDFAKFDYIMAVDKQNLEYLFGVCPVEWQHRLFLISDFTEALKGDEIPDPYYGSNTGFEIVYRMLDACLQDFLIYLTNSSSSEIPPDNVMP